MQIESMRTRSSRWPPKSPAGWVVHSSCTPALVDGIPMPTIVMRASFLKDSERRRLPARPVAFGCRSLRRLRSVSRRGFVDSRRGPAASSPRVNRFALT